MITIPLQLPDELAQQVIPLQERLPEIIELGLRHWRKHATSDRRVKRTRRLSGVIAPDLRQLEHRPSARTVTEASANVAAFRDEVLAALGSQRLSPDEPLLNGLTLGQYDALSDDEKASLWDRWAQVDLMEMDEIEVSPDALPVG